MGETLEEIQQPVSPTMVVQSDSEESTASTLGLSPGLSGMDLSGDTAEGRVGADPRSGEGGDAQEGEFLCRWGTCEESFSHVDLLASHVTCIHAASGENGLFFCGWRGCSRGKRGFNARYKMLIHVRTHTNEKPHRCPRCDKSFSRAENLKIHARSHTGERPYVCPVPGCGKAYSNSSDRFKHTRTHSVERPYACRVPGCSKRYTDPSSLRKHVKTYAHYHRPTSDENSKAAEQEECDQNKTNTIVKVDVKSTDCDSNPKINQLGKNTNKTDAEEEKNLRNLRNSRNSSRKPSKVAIAENEKLPVKNLSESLAEKNNLKTSESIITSNGSVNGDVPKCGRLQQFYGKASSSPAWDAVPDDKWLENDIEEVEEDDDSNQGGLPVQPEVELKESYCMSDEEVRTHLGHPKVDNGWSSGADEEWMSDGSDYTLCDRSKIKHSVPSYLKFTNSLSKSSLKHYYLAEQHLISKLSKKNYILSRSYHQRLNDLLLKSYSNYESVQCLKGKNYDCPLDSFQPMDYSCSASHQKSQAAGKYSVLNDMAYHSIPYEQVVPLDLRKVN
ncbi:Krueppel homolog 1-like [Ischnura elegans]|uniref:Krueppel homolog 1-like n=1 Tax=Ischnura elegans TaxID=197161 RepID=UPI001ED891AE|nr:Krueppel homolog 1-like [Ischnura elegans]XP_046405286.1 Krueppel homolog 1-like [Ischnura elegans]